MSNIACHSEQSEESIYHLEYSNNYQSLKIFYTLSLMKIHASHNYYIYILTNKNKSVLYVGVTNNLKERLYFHKNPLPFSKAFTTKYKCFYLIYYEQFFDIEDAIKREKQIKGKSRAKKESLINDFNPKWSFLNDDI